MNATNNFKPILFNTEMVQAILAGRKTQTRRIAGLKKINTEPDNFGLGNVRLNNFWNFFRKTTEKGEFIHSNFQIADILWVRETWQTSYNENSKKWDPIYKADGKFWIDDDGPIKWKPSLFMQKKHCRIFLKVTNVRCERLQDISEEDAIAEGIERYGPFGEFKGDPHPNGGMMRFRAYSKAARAFQDLWDSINAKKHPWESNPWVWVYDFERIEKPTDFN